VPGAADSDLPSSVQLELPFVVARFKGKDPKLLLSDPVIREWIANLWNRHQLFLLELAHYHLRDWERAEEVVQDMWVDFIKSAPRFQGRCSEKTWLVQILRRCIKKEQRRTVLQRAREAILGAFEWKLGEHHGSRLGSGAEWYENPEQLLLAQECLEEIWRAGRSLPKQQAEVWFLRDVDERTSEDVATALGLTPENLRVLRHRAHQRLNAALRRYFGKRKTARPVRTKAHDLQRS
jgi:RNA polymerase sigma-70 factor (ECF subfamily)